MVCRSEEIGASLVAAASRRLAGARGEACCEEAAAGDSAEWGDFYERCDGMIRRFVAAMRVAPAERDDCVQDAWVHVLERLPALRFDPSRGRFSTWLFTVVRSAIIDRQRREAAERARRTADIAAAGRAGRPSHQAERCESSEVMELVLGWLAAHRASYCTLVKLRWVEEQPVAAAAKATGMSQEQVRVCEHRLRKRLRKLLSELRVAER